jgi:hypothetical protein
MIQCALSGWLWNRNTVIADGDIASFLSRADKIPSSIYDAYRKACASAEKQQPESKALGHLQFLYFPFL